MCQNENEYGEILIQQKATLRSKSHTKSKSKSKTQNHHHHHSEEELTPFKGDLANYPGAKFARLSPAQAQMMSRITPAIVSSRIVPLH